MERSIKTATDKEYEIQFMGATVIGITSILYIEFIGKTMMQIVPVFSNPDETSYLRGFIGGELHKEFRGYTNLVEAIIVADTGNLRIALTVPIEMLGE